MSVLHFLDKYGDEVIVHPRYIHYRNRSIDSYCIDEIRTKGNRLLINSYKQNTISPTLCIHFDTKKEAEDIHAILLETWFPSDESPVATSSWCYWSSSCCRRPSPPSRPSRSSRQRSQDKEE